MANGGVGNLAQTTVGQAGPFGAAISAVSQAGEGATAGSQSGAVRGAGQLIFNPARNIDALSDPNLGTGAKLAGLLLPGAGELFRDNNGLPDIQREDPRQTERLLEIDRIAKNIQAGTDAPTQLALQAGQENVAQTQSRLGRVTGPGTVDAFLKAQAAGDQAANQAIAQGQQRVGAFLNLGQQLQNRISQRTLELDLLDRAQFSAERAQDEKEANINRQGQLGTAIATGAFDPETFQQVFQGFGADQAANQGIGGATGFVNPNDSLVQTPTDPNQANPTVSQAPVQGVEVTNVQGVSAF